MAEPGSRPRAERVQKLHLVGFTTDHEGLILSARRGARSGGYVLTIDGALEEAIEDLRQRRAAAATEQTDLDASEDRVPRVESALPVREIQARLRQGRSVAEVAKAAGVEPGWVERFAAPVLAEQAQVVAKVRSMPLRRARLGASAQPIGDAVRHHLAARKVALTDDEFADSWSARQLGGGRWVVFFGYRYRGRDQTLQFDFDESAAEVTAADRASGQLGYVTPDDPAAGGAPPRGGRPSSPAAKSAGTSTGARAGKPSRRGTSRSAKERERAATAMRKAAQRRATEMERSAARRERERAVEAARREREEKAAAARAEREERQREAATAAADRAKAVAAKKAAADKARADTAKAAERERAAERARAARAKAAVEKKSAADKARAGRAKAVGAKKAAAAKARADRAKAATKKPAADHAPAARASAAVEEKTAADEARADRTKAAAAKNLDRGHVKAVAVETVTPSERGRPRPMPVVPPPESFARRAERAASPAGEAEPLRPLFRRGLVERAAIEDRARVVSRRADGDLSHDTTGPVSGNGSGGLDRPKPMGADRPRRTRPLRAT